MDTICMLVAKRLALQVFSQRKGKANKEERIQAI